MIVQDSGLMSADSRAPANRSSDGDYEDLIGISNGHQASAAKLKEFTRVGWPLDCEVLQNGGAE